jgi:hypothetical protein
VYTILCCLGKETATYVAPAFLYHTCVNTPFLSWYKLSEGTQQRRGYSGMYRPAARLRPANKKRGMVFSARPKQQLTAAEKMCFLCGPCRDVISSTIKLVSGAAGTAWEPSKPVISFHAPPPQCSVSHYLPHFFLFLLTTEEV